MSALAISALALTSNRTKLELKRDLVQYFNPQINTSNRTKLELKPLWAQGAAAEAAIF